MRRPHFLGKKFLGDTYKKEVHNLDREDTATGGCQINKIIREGHAITFYPDTLTEAHRLGYDNCVKCLSDSFR
jgi:hypothetical protein